jgi:hypothetical protein
MKMMPNRSRREAGFAMLLVFLMASCVALMLYKEIPRIAMDAQRQKEQLLIMRGEQYKRAIQMFVITNKRWPTKIEELESLNNRRYLRKRYIDPMTGKDEWRLVHIQNGMLTDSVVTKPPAKPGDQANADTYKWGGSSIGVEAGMGQDSAGTALAGANLANRKRASDGQALPSMASGGEVPPIDPNNPAQQPPGTPGAPGIPGMPQQPGVVNGQPNPGFPPGVVLPPGVPGVPGQPPIQAGQYPGQYPGQVQQPYPGQPGQSPIPSQPGQFPVQPPNQYPAQPGQYPYNPGLPVNSQQGGVSPQPYPINQGANGAPPPYPQPGNPINPVTQGPNQAQQMIQQILTTPRPGGMPGAGGQSPTMGGGIAGVASNADAEAIMVYADRTNYKEWEFIFDPNKYRAPPNPLSGNTGTPASQLGSIGGNQIGTPVTGMPGAGGQGFGQTPGGFGSTPGGFGSAPGGGPVFNPGALQSDMPVVGPRRQ